MTTVDIQTELFVLNQALSRQHDFESASNKSIATFVHKTVHEMQIFVSNYFSHNKLKVHHHKEVLLHKIIYLLQDMKKRAHVYMHDPDNLDIKILSNGYMQLVQFFGEYSKHGSLYVVRHCNKTKRLSHTGKEYVGISKKDMVEQARSFAKEITNEILMSPKPVRLIIEHSGADRTRIFGGVINTMVNGIRWKKHSKINVRYEENILLGESGEFPNYIESGVTPVYKDKGEWHCVVNFFRNSHEFHSFHPEYPKHICNDISEFVHKYKSLTHSAADYYTIVIGLSHSWFIDWYLFTLMPELMHSSKKVIDTADFFKVEHNQLCFKGKWVDF